MTTIAATSRASAPSPDSGSMISRPWPRVLAVLLVASTLTGAFASPSSAGAGRVTRPTRQAAPSQDGGGGLKAEYDEITKSEAALLQRIDAAKAEQLRLTAQLQTLQADVLVKQQELVVAQADLKAAEAKKLEQAKQRRAAQKQVQAARERLRKQIVASFVAGGETGGALEAILRSDNGEDAGNALAYTKAIVGGSDRLVKELKEAEAAARKADADAKAAQTRSENRRDEVSTSAALLTEAVDQQKQVVEQVNVQVVEVNDALNAVLGRKAAIEGEIANFNRTSDGVAQFLADFQAQEPDWKAGAVDITNPIPGYQVGSKFGPRVHPILGTVRLHAGSDMGAPAGSPIYAPADGIVVLAGERGGYGNATVIDHGNSLATLYGHQSRIDVKPGQSVKRGDQIGLVGSTGLSTGPHLHFETRLRGVPTNPESIVDFSRPGDSYAAEQERNEALLAAAIAANGN